MGQTKQEDELRAQAIFNASVDGIITISARGIIESINPAASELFAYESDEVVGKNISMLMPEPHRKKHDGYLDNYHTTGHKKIIGIGREVEGLRKDGSTFPFRLAVGEIKIKTRTIFTGFIHDITHQKEAENALLELTEKLERKVRERTEELAQVIEETQFVNQQLQDEITKRKKAEVKMQKALKEELELGELKSRFVSMASHEFRTPLTGILSSITLIGKYNTLEQEEKKLKHVRRIRSSVQNLTNILNDFLSFDKLQAGKIKGHPIEFKFSSFLIELVGETNQLKKSEQELILVENNEIDNFYSDPQLLKNILLNLFSNAIKYSEEKKKIEIYSTLKKSGLLLKVKDEGKGIPQEEQIHLFERFFRARNASNIQGTGLGLNIVQQYVHLLGGKISFESAENVGSTFQVEIPFYSIKTSNKEVK
ncbi:MAG: PAS domain S-box-containing protein [Vicingaceae bacterium]|jgi:PAS domain S-box-containing protein